MTFHIVLIQFCLISILINLCYLWPVPYAVDLHQSDNFIISDPINFEDVSDVYQEEEMIKEEELNQLTRHKNDKFYQIHQWANKRRNFEEKQNRFKMETATGFVPRLKEDYPEASEPVPWEAGFVDEEGRYIHPENERVYYVNDMAKKLIQKKIAEKREDQTQNIVTQVEDVNDKNLEAEYEEEVKVAKALNESLRYNDTKEEETLKESIADVLRNKVAKNCTEEERTGFGLGAMRCFISDINKPNTDKPKLIHKLLLIVGIWFFIYLVIAIPCFCQRGWCCCCFYCCCKFCRPHECIEEAKVYLAKNPLGVMHDGKGNELHYEPTNYERYAHKKLNNALMKL